LGCRAVGVAYGVGDSFCVTLRHFLMVAGEVAMLFSEQAGSENIAGELFVGCILSCLQYGCGFG